MPNALRPLPPFYRRLWLRFLAAAVALAPMARATDINWNSTIGANNYTSAGEGSPMGSGFVFELGAFAVGFVPTVANTAQWAANWVALDRDAYNSASRFFTSKAALASNALPFHFTRRAHIWGFNPQWPGEWILVTNPAWLWPFADGGIQPPVTWSIGASGTTAVVGEVNGAGFQMKTAFVAGASVPDVNPDAWRQQFFTSAERSDPAVSGWEADPDGDGAGNLYELAAGSDPRKGGSRPAPVVEVVASEGGGLALQLRLPRLHRAAIFYGAEASQGLAGWSGDGVAIISDLPGEIVFRSPAGPPIQTFMRFRFTL